MQNYFNIIKDFVGIFSDENDLLLILSSSTKKIDEIFNLNESSLPFNLKRINNYTYILNTDFTDVNNIINELNFLNYNHSDNLQLYNDEDEILIKCSNCIYYDSFKYSSGSYNIYTENPCESCTDCNKCNFFKK